VYYQWQIVKKWCTLCLVIQAILVLEFAVIFTNNSIEMPSIHSAFLLIISFLMPTAIWFFVKPSLEKAGTIPNLERSLMTYKYNNEIFMNHLENQRAVPVSFSPIILGNEDAPVLVTMVSNPFCGPCAKAHEALDNLMAVYTDYLKVEFIFTGGGQSPEVIKHICSLEKSHIHNALNDWYKTVNHEKWATKYPTEITEESENQFNNFTDWSNQAQITHTPTIFINGKELVSPYTIQDLKYHVKVLAEQVSV
jgi:thiol-disulfide isomerase/thioredoxin